MELKRPSPAFARNALCLAGAGMIVTGAVFTVAAATSTSLLAPRTVGQEFDVHALSLMRDPVTFKPLVRVGDVLGHGATFEISEEASSILQDLEDKGDRRSICVTRIDLKSRVAYVQMGKCNNPARSEMVSYGRPENPHR